VKPGPGSERSTDSYLPQHGNGGYGVEHYDLDLDYKVDPNRLTGRAVLTAVAGQPLTRFTLDLGTFKVPRVSVDGRAAKFTHRGGKLRITPARPIAEGAAFTVEVRYVGNPKPVSSRWGDVGWDELRNGALVASQPVGAPSWFPCNDHPTDKATYRIAVTTDAPYAVLVTGVLISRRRSAGTRTWVYERPEPTATYLVSVQIGQYDEMTLAPGRLPQTAAVPSRLRRDAARDLGRHGKIMTTLEGFFGPYPFGNYQLVVTDDALDDPIEAQGMSIFGANHIDGRRTHERLVVHELAHQWFGNSLTLADWRHIWLNEGFATYAEWLWSESTGDRSATSHAREWHAGGSGATRRPGARRPRHLPSVRPTRLQAGCAGAARSARPDRGRPLLRTPPRLGRPVPARNGGDRAVRRAGRDARGCGPLGPVRRLAPPPGPPPAQVTAPLTRPRQPPGRVRGGARPVRSRGRGVRRTSAG